MIHPQRLFEGNFYKELDPFGDSAERVQILEVSDSHLNINEINPDQLQRKLADKVLVHSALIRSPWIYSNKQDVLKAIDFLEMFCLYSGQLKLRELDSEKLKPSFLFDKDVNYLPEYINSVIQAKTIHKTLSELEQFRKCVENKADAQTMTPIRKRLDQHIDKLFVHNLGPIEQRALSHTIAAAKTVLKKYRA